MQEFLQNHLINWLTYIQAITIFLGYRFFNKTKQVVAKYFVIIFLVGYLLDQLGKILKDYFDVSHNLYVYNVSFFVMFLFLFWLYHRTIKNIFFKKLIIVFTILYLSSLLLEPIVYDINYLEKTQVLPYIIAGIAIIISILFYFFEILNSKKIINIDRNLVFWISIAYFFYFLVFVPFKVEQNFYALSEKHIYLFNLRIIITLFFNMILIFGFIWSKPEDK